MKAYSKPKHVSKINILPVSGTSVGLIILLICSIDCKSGERPKTAKC